MCSSQGRCFCSAGVPPSCRSHRSQLACSRGSSGERSAGRRAIGSCRPCATCIIRSWLRSCSIVGVRLEVSVAALGLGLVYVTARTAGTIAGGRWLRRGAHRFERVMLLPGVTGLALALNVLIIAPGSEPGLMLAVVALGSMAAENRGRRGSAARGGRMTRALAVALMLGVMAVLRLLDDRGGMGVPATRFALGFTLVVALVTGEVLRRFRLPRLTGYLLFGLASAPTSPTSSPKRWRGSSRRSPASRPRSSRSSPG